MNQLNVPISDEIVNKLALEAIQISGEKLSEIEKCCWMVVHEYIHGVMPVEYDVREIDECLYLSVLKKVRKGS